MKGIKDIKIKAKTKDYGEWISGYYVYNNEYDIYFIFTGDWNGYRPNNYARFSCYIIDPKTIRRYTEHIDRFDEDLYEGDICSLEGYRGFREVSWDDEKHIWKWGDVDIEDVFDGTLEIIGNNIDNLELLKGESDGKGKN